MTDDEADELLHPPSQWPPLSATTAAGLLLFPPLASTGFHLALSYWSAAVASVIALLIFIRPAMHLFPGSEPGIGCGLGVVALVFLVAATPFVVRLTSGVGWTDVVWFLPVIIWMLLTGYLIWWPETRRWCGVLPPAEPEED